MTLTEARRRLQFWLDAEEAIASGQEYSVGTMALTRADLGAVAKRISYYEARVAALESDRGLGARVVNTIPRDL